MNYTNVRMTYANEGIGDALPEPWVRLEQVLPSRLSQFASIRDVYRLWLAAVTGTSAQTLRAANCPVEFVGAETHVYLGFYAWPSDPALVYALTSAIGTLGERQIIRKQREFSRFLDNSNRFDLPYYMEEIEVDWETPCFDRYGEGIPVPTITPHNTWLEFSSDVFGAVRITGTAIGVYCLCEMVLTRAMEEEEISAEEATEQRERDEAAGLFLSYVPPTTRLNGYKVENLENTITAAWLVSDGSTETDQLDLEIPQCVQDVLAFCPDMYKTLLLWCKKVSTRQVYYSTCDGSLLGVFDGVDPRSYCTRTEVGDSFDPENLT